MGSQTTGSYHHHQNPSAFNAASVPLSSVCNVYLADGLYVPDSSHHGPLIGFAFDGFPIYGGYGYASATGTGGIKRMVPSYRFRSITDRTTLSTGPLTSSQYGPSLATQALGAYNEDYEYVANSGDLDVHNGRFCVTPEYPQGIYCYFATVDAAGNSVFPYVMGQTYYGVVEQSNFGRPGGTTSTSVVVPSTGVSIYLAPTVGVKGQTNLHLKAYPSPANDLLVVQATLPVTEACTINILDLQGRVVQTQTMNPGSTMVYFDTQTLHAGTYILRTTQGSQVYNERIVIE
jgi:hypothetical protein